MWRIKEGGLLFVPGEASPYSAAKTEVGVSGGYFGHRGDEPDVFFALQTLTRGRAGGSCCASQL